MYWAPCCTTRNRFSRSCPRRAEKKSRSTSSRPAKSNSVSISSKNSSTAKALFTRPEGKLTTSEQIQLTCDLMVADALNFCTSRREGRVGSVPWLWRDSSAASDCDWRVEGCEFDTRVSGCELPVDGGLLLIAGVFPGGDACLHCASPVDAAGEALTGQGTQFNFRRRVLWNGAASCRVSACNGTPGGSTDAAPRPAGMLHTVMLRDAC